MDRNDLRSRNLELLRSALRSLRVVTKPQAAEVTGLSVVTVNTLMQELMEAGEAKLMAEGTSSGGRPAQQYAFCADYRLALAVYLHEEAGRDTMFIAVVDLLGNKLMERKMQPEEITLELFLQVLRPYFQQYPQISALVVGLPGMEQNGKLVVVDYPVLQDVAFAGRLQQELACPVYVENDINAAVLGYSSTLGSRALQETIVGIYLPQNYPPGAGISLAGKIYKGRDGMAGEIGNRLQFKYSGAGLSAMQSIVRRMAELVVLFTATWNPYRLVFYQETVTQKQLSDIQQLAAEHFAVAFLPKLELRPSIYEDYGRGICQLAMKYLNSNRNEEF